jgi:hypothetical protein
MAGRCPSPEDQFIQFLFQYRKSGIHFPNPPEGITHFPIPEPVANVIQHSLKRPVAGNCYRVSVRHHKAIVLYLNLFQKLKFWNSLTLLIIDIEFQDSLGNSRGNFIFRIIKGPNKGNYRDKCDKNKNQIAHNCSPHDQHFQPCGQFKIID